MPQSLTCSNGHRWEVSSSRFGGHENLCPICGNLPETLREGSPDGTPPVGRAGETPGSLTVSSPPILSPVPSAGPSPALAGLVTPLPVIPGYELLGVLGRGGMGIVYKARQRELGRLVAVKMLVDTHASPELVKRFRTEGEAMARLQHPNVVQIHEVGQAEGRPFFALEYVSGGSLAEKTRGVLQAPREAAELVVILARAVHFAHLQGILHRDLKPANVLLSSGTQAAVSVAGAPGQAGWPHGVPKITDFGLAKRLEMEAEGHRLTRSGEVMGTPSYMAPEQASGMTRNLGPATDVYALGAIFYELLVGRPPFVGETLMETLFQVIQEEPVPLRRLAPKVPRDLETICLKCLEKRPRARYLSALELAEDLGRFLRGEPIHARPVGRGERLIKWARRRPTRAALVGVCLLALLIGVAGGVGHQVQMHNKNIELTIALAEKERQRTRNVTLLRTSLAILGNFGDRFDDQLASLPHLEPMRKKLLEDRLRYYEPFLKMKPDDPEMLQRQGEALFAVAVIHQRMGKLPEAEKRFREVIQLFKGGLEDAPTPVARLNLGNALVQFGMLLETLTRYPAAEENIRRGLALLEQARTESGEEADNLEAVALAAHNLGHLLHAMRHLDEAGVSYNRALAIRKRLVAEYPGEDRYRFALAVTSNNLGALYLGQKQASRAEEAFGETRRLLDQLAPRMGRDVDHRRMMAGVCHNLATLAQSRDPRQALALHRQARDLWRKLRDDFPVVPAFRTGLARAEFVHALFLGQVKQVPAALAALRRAHDLYQDLAREQPGVVGHEEGIGDTLYHLGRLLGGQRKVLEAEKYWRAYEETCRSLVRQNPDRPTYQANLGIALGEQVECETIRIDFLMRLPPIELGMTGHDLTMSLHALTNLYLWRGYLDKAIGLGREGLQHLRRARSLEPANPSFGSRLSWQSRVLTTLARIRGNREALADGARGLAETAEGPVLGPSDPAVQYFLAAGFLAHCATLARTGEDLSVAERTRLARTHADEAVKMLTRAVEKGFRNRSHLQRDQDLAQLQNRPDFQKLLARMGAK